MSLEEDLVSMARLALEGSRRDVELYVHRLAYRYRNTPLGASLAEIDVVPPVSLREGDELITIEYLTENWARYQQRARQVYWDRDYPACRAKGKYRAVCLLPPDHEGDHFGNGSDQWGPRGSTRWKQ